MNPTLRKLSDSRISRQQIAALLERHIGESPSTHHCAQAVEALARIRDANSHAVAHVLAELLDAKSDPCTTIRAVIGNFRSDWPESQ